MRPPLSENITTIVNSSAINVSGLTRGMNTRSYHSRPRARTSARRLTMPASSGMPRYTRTVLAISVGPTSTTTLPTPNSGGSSVRKTQAYNP